MKRAHAASLVLFGTLAASSTARAEDVEQSNQLIFGAQLSYVPQQRNMISDVLAIGHYVSYAHRMENFVVGVRAAIAYGWLPSGDPGQQGMIAADAFIGAHLPFGKRFALRLDAGLGPLVNWGEGFATTSIAHAYARATAQLMIAKSVTIEAFGGPSFVFGQSVLGLYPELGLGVGWTF